MRYRVLGPLLVEDGGGVVPIGGPKEHAVLAQLLAHVNRVVPAERLAAGLWGDAPPATAERTLLAYVARLRRVLEPGDRVGRRHQVVVTAADGWVLRATPKDIDAYRFEAFVAGARAALASGLVAHAADALATALGLWHGPPYAGFAELPGCDAEAVRLTELRALAEEERLTALLRLGESSQVAAEAKALVSAEPLRERRWALLIHALYAAGRQGDALHAFARARDLLGRELGVDPGPELQRLHAAVLAHDPALLTGAGLAPYDRTSPAPAGPLFMGREAEIRQLATRWTGAVAGCGGVQLVAGPEGIGKTRLVTELGRRAEAQGGLVLRASAEDGDGRPYGSLRAVATVAGLRWAEVVGVNGDPSGLPARLAELESPVLVVLDDLDRADTATITALPALGDAASTVPVLLVAVYRDGPGNRALAGLETGGLPCLHLGSLSDEHVAAIAALYAGQGVDLDVASIVAGSSGVPLRAHRLASRAAVELTSRRVSTAVRRVIRRRRGFNAVHDELVAGVLAGQRIRRQAAFYLSEAARSGSSAAPYKGLASFDQADSDLFFGRERLVAELVTRLAGGGLLAVVGPSGSGKSSLINAGMVSALRADALPGSGSWRIDVLTPGAGRPPPGPGDSRLLIIDQLEELFTALAPPVAEAVVAAIVDAARHSRVVVGLRSDFFADAARYPDLAKLLETGTVLLGPMRTDELRSAVIDPAGVVGVEVADDLVDAVVDDVAGEPGALPLMSVALLETYARRDGAELQLADYQAAGGVRGALARLAEQAYGKLNDVQQRAARRVLLRLAQDDHGRLVRRRTPLAELAPPGDTDAAAVIDTLVHRRLLVAADDIVEVAHEALLTEWPRCREWLADDVAGREVRTHLTAAAAAWQAAGHADADLYRGPRLAAAWEWASGHPGDLTAVEREFLDRSREASGRDRLAAEARAAREARQARRLRFSLVATVVLLVISLIAGLLATRSADRARTSATAADAARLGALALTEPRVDTAALLAAQAVTLHPSAQTQADLLSTLLRWPEIRRVTAPLGRLYGLGPAPDGKTLAVGDNLGHVALVDVATWHRRGPVFDSGHPYPIMVASFSPDGRFLVGAGSTDYNGQEWVLSVWEVASGRLMQQTATAAAGLFLWAPPGAPVTAVSGSDKAAVIWTGAPGAWRQHTYPGVWVAPAAFSKDGRRVLIAERTSQAAWHDVDTWRPTARLRLSAGSGLAVLSPDRNVLAVGYGNGTTQLLDARTGQLLRTLAGQRGWQEAMDFDDSGRRLLTANDDGTAVVWDVATGQRLWSFSGLGGTLGIGALFAPSAHAPGDRLYLAGHDGTLLDIDLTSSLLARRFRGPAGAAVAAWPAGDTALLGGSAGTTPIALAAAGVGHTERSVDGVVTALTPMADGTGLVMGTSRSEIAIVDATGRMIRRIEREPDRRANAWTGIAAAPAARLIVAVNRAGWVRAYDGITGSQLWNRRLTAFVISPWDAGPTVAYDHRRGRLAVGVASGDVALLDPLTGRLRKTIHVADQLPVPPAVAFDPHTGDLITGSRDGNVRFWHPDTGRSASDPLPSLPASINAVSVSATGDRAATLGSDGSVAVWDTAAHRLLGRLPTRSAGASAIALAPDGRRLLVAEPDGTVAVWNLDQASWLQAACSLAGRQLSVAEWHRFLPERPYAPAC